MSREVIVIVMPEREAAQALSLSDMVERCRLKESRDHAVVTWEQAARMAMETGLAKMDKRKGG